MSFKAEFLRLLKEDEEFRYAVAGLLGLTKLEEAVARLVEAVEELVSESRKQREELAKIWQEIHALREEDNKIWQEIKTMKEENQKILQEIKALREGQEKLWEENRKIWEEIKALRESEERLWEEVKAIKEENHRIWQEIKLLRESQEKLWEENRKIWEEVKAMREGQAKLWEEIRKIWEEVKALREGEEKLWEESHKIWEEIKTMREGQEKLWEEIKAMRVRFELRFDALGARWGLVSEEAFREGVREILRAAGFSAGRWTYFDSEGYVYGRPSEVDVDVVVHNGKVFLVEITSALKRGDLALIKRKAELYERAAGKRPDAVIVVTAFVHDKTPDFVRELAERMGIKIVKPWEPPVG